MKTYLNPSIQTQLSSAILQMLHKIQEKKFVKEFNSKRGEKKLIIHYHKYSKRSMQKVLR